MAPGCLVVICGSTETVRNSLFRSRFNSYDSSIEMVVQVKDWVQVIGNPEDTKFFIRYNPRTEDATVAMKGCLSVLLFVVLFTISYVYFLTFIINNGIQIGHVFLWIIPLCISSFITMGLYKLLSLAVRIFSGPTKKATIAITEDYLDISLMRIEFRKILRFQFSHKVDQGCGILYAILFSGERIPVTTEITQSQGQGILRIILQFANANGYSIN